MDISSLKKKEQLAKERLEVAKEELNLSQKRTKQAEKLNGLIKEFKMTESKLQQTEKKRKSLASQKLEDTNVSERGAAKTGPQQKRIRLAPSGNVGIKRNHQHVDSGQTGHYKTAHPEQR